MHIIKVYIQRNTYKLNRLFTYRIDELDYEKLQPGSAVLVEFNKTKVVGYVVEKLVDPNIEYEIKKIIKVIEYEVLNENGQGLFNFIMTTQVTSYVNALRLVLPSKIRKFITGEKNFIKKETRQQLGFKTSGNVVTLTTKQQLVYDYILVNEEATKIQIKKILKVSDGVIKKLLELEAIIPIQIKFDYQPQLINEEEKNIIYTEEQLLAIEQISNTNKDVLLYGVTGSGKTEIYIEIIKKYLNKDKQVLLLVPEITLTIFLATRLSKIFKDQVVFIHSGLSDSEFFNYYQKIKNNEVKVIIGTRSSIFMPFNNLGLIIVDEEHDTSYKNNFEPFYHTRDIIEFWKNKGVDKVIYGTATPSLETYARAEKDIYQLVLLKNRYNQNPLPKIELDLINDYNLIFTANTLLKIKKALSNNEKVVILYNKKGYASSIECSICNHIPACPNCNVPLTYYQRINAIKCNYCGFSKTYKNHCPSCKNEGSFITHGIGIEQVNAYLNTMFGNDNILSLDANIAKNKTKLYKILNEFKESGPKILLGTQIISKGLDFTSVNLVVVVNIDNALYFNDLRANERVFQLLVQTAGRSGRHNKNGKVLIQTKHPVHKLFKYVRTYDYKGFYKDEMQNRKLQRNTPYFYVGQVEVIHDQKEIAKSSLKKLKFRLDKIKIFTTNISTPYVEKYDGRARQILLFKYKQEDILDILKTYKLEAERENIQVNIDLNIY